MLDLVDEAFLGEAADDDSSDEGEDEDVSALEDDAERAQIRKDWNTVAASWETGLAG